MGALDDLIRNAVTLANSLTADLQATVSHEAWIGQDSRGKPNYDDPVSRQAVVDFRQVRRRLADGSETLQAAKLTFVGPITANGATGRREPIDNRDRITLPNGYTGPIVEVLGVVDPTTNAPYAIDVVLG